MYKLSWWSAFRSIVAGPIGLGEDRSRSQIWPGARFRCIDDDVHQEDLQEIRSRLERAVGIPGVPAPRMEQQVGEYFAELDRFFALSGIEEEEIAAKLAIFQEGAFS